MFPKDVLKNNGLRRFNERVVQCELCPRLRHHCTLIAERKRRAYQDWTYWGLPVPSFGDPKARVAIVGLAPGAHGSNRTGRPFTGDGSGDFLYPVLHATGFASQPKAWSFDDGLVLKDLWITSVVRCAPPDNKPLPDELRNCAPYLDEELSLLKSLRVVVCLGKIALDGYVNHLVRTGQRKNRSGFTFAHGAEWKVANEKYLLASYHPSLQNTNTGRLTAEMLSAIFDHAKQLANT